MKATRDLTIKKTSQSRLAEADRTNLSFGATPTDHMFTCEYKDGGWQNPEIIPFGEISLSPFAHCFHYGQTIFEGLKAYRMTDGNASVFRPGDNYSRMVRSAERMCMPEIPRELFFDGLTALVGLDNGWIPDTKGGSLYLRPFLIATEPRLGVKIAEEYRFMIVAAPAGNYFSHPLKLKVETDYVRTADGGVGFAKCGGNYAAGYFPTKKAKESGFDQVIWTDSRQNRFIEESGVMNIMLAVDDQLLTPPATSSILAGITRDSLLTLAGDYGLKPAEQKISVEQLESWLATGKVREVFGSGTAAVISPVAEIAVGTNHYRVPVKEDSFMYWAKQRLEAIRTGAAPDKYGWNYIIKMS